MSFTLFDEQLEALDRMKNGCILCGDTGSGKSIAALAYYYMQNGGNKSFLEGQDYVWMKNPKQLYIITTAKKRDMLEWESDMAPFLLSAEKNSGYYNPVYIDSWNNIRKYADVKDSFFIFDEQRVVGKGAWVKAFLNIAKNNEWILLSATPGDAWCDYIPVFIANGFYKNRTQFNDEHVIYNPYVRWTSILKYVNTKKLEKERDSILIIMESKRHTVQHHIDIDCNYEVFEYKQVIKYKTHIDSLEPIENASAYTYELRKIVNRDPSRAKKILEIYKVHPRLIIFYSFDYELDILRALKVDCPIKEWNGHKHEALPEGDSWIYLVQYSSGNEGWNCISTDAMIFYSQTHSYKMTKQAAGRIDRLNTPYTDLYYYHLVSKSPIDIKIKRCLSQKKDFNYRSFAKDFKPKKENDILTAYSHDGDKYFANYGKN